MENPSNLSPFTLTTPKKVIDVLNNAGFANAMMETYEEGSDGIYLFRAEKH